MYTKSNMGPILFFVILTIIYAVIKYKVTGRQQMIWGLIYLGILLTGMFFINLSMTKEMCGSTQPSTAILVTTVPWLMVFGVMALMLIAFPGWLAPFSNTFGYLIAKLAGLDSIADKIIAPDAVTSNTPASTKAAAVALEQIYSDKALLINQLTPSNFEGFWSKMSNAKLFNAGANQYKTALYNLVRMKQIVAEFVWAVLSGGLATSIATSYIQGSACQRSAEEMMKQHNQFEEEQENTEKKAPRVYEVSN